MTAVFTRAGRDTETQNRQPCEAGMETGVTLPQAQDCQEASGTEEAKGFSLMAFGESMHC